MQYSTLIAQIEADIYSNGAELITGDILQTVLKRMVSAWASAGAAYGGTIAPDTVVPLNLDQATVYLALTAGTYEHFLDGNGDPIETTGPALVIYDGGPALIFTKTDLPSGGSGATVITVSPGDSLVITLPKAAEGIKGSYRIDMTAAVFGGDDDARYIGSLIIECNELEAQTAHGYYYGDDMADILSEVAIWKDDPEMYPEEQSYYLLLTTQSDLDEVIFSVSALDGQSVQMYESNEDEKVKVADATITPVGGSSDVFWAEYGVTTASEIESAISAGKIVVCFYNSACYTFGRLETNYIYLSTTRQERYYNIAIHRTNNTWQTLSATFELSGNKVSTLSGNETNTTKYPNTKAVADALGKMGVISQTQTWSGTGSTRTYVMSNPVTGLIPQANIDLFESAGAVFNETSGYFELNGLTDISYEEMSAIYNFGQLPYAISNYLYQVRYIRTNLPTARITADSLSTFALDSSLEVVAFNPNADFRPAGTGGAYAFYSMNNLKRIIGVLNLSAITSGARFVEYSLLLGDFRFKSLKFSISLMSPFVTKDSLLYLINNEASTSAITITLEASVYAKCQSGGEWYSDISTALAAHTNISLASA